MKKTLAILFILFLGCGATAGAIDFSTLAAGMYAHELTERTNVVITDQESFDAFWYLVDGGMTPPEEAPEVDFTTDMAIGVSPGEMSSGGYTVEITEITSDGKKITVTVVLTMPTGPVTLALTQPFRIITLKRSTLPVEFVWIERQDMDPAE